MSFTGTLDKCKACDKTVYVMDLLTLEGNTYHKSCFRCSHCKGTLVVFLFSSSSIVTLFSTMLSFLLFKDQIFFLKTDKQLLINGWSSLL